MKPAVHISGCTTNPIDCTGWETVRNNSIAFDEKLKEVTKTLNSVDISKLDYRLAGLRHQVGFRPDEFSGISAFESIKTLANSKRILEEKQEDLERNLNIIEAEVAQRSMSDEDIATMEKWKQNPPATKSALSKNITNVWQRVRMSYDKKISNLNTSVSSLEVKFRNFQAGNRVSTHSACPTPAVVADLQREILDLKTVLKRHSNMLESGQVISNGIVITGRSNLETIIQSGLTPSTELSTGAACFLDCSTLLHYASVKCNNEAKDLLKLLNKSKEMHSFMEVVQEAASDVQIPILFMGKAKPEEFNVDRRKLPAISAYKDFDEGYMHGGLKSTIELYQGIALSDALSNIDRHLKGQANQIAKTLLNTMNNFISALLMWMQSKYTSLKATMGEGCKDTSWLFVTHSVVSIFTLIHQEKRSHGGDTGSDSVSKAWASLRLSNLIDHLLKTRISDHSVVTQVMNQHLHVNSVTRAEFTAHSESLSALSDRVETSRKELDNLTQKVNQLKKK